MVETTNRSYASNASKDYKKRFEFKLTVGENIICQRYFSINNFNPTSLVSVELPNALEECAKLIQNDLLDKTAVYLELTAPKMFKSEEEMETYFEKEENRNAMHLGEGIIVKTTPVKAYAWGKNMKPLLLKENFDRGDYSNPLTSEDWVDYKLAFFDNGTEVCSVGWTGCYPRAVRNSIDLSNKRGKFDGEDISRLSFDSYILFKMVEGKKDLVYQIIKEISSVCCYENSSDYTTRLTYVKANGKKADYNYDCAVCRKDLNEELKRLSVYYGQVNR